MQEDVASSSTTRSPPARTSTPRFACAPLNCQRYGPQRRPVRLFFVDDHPVIASGLIGRYGGVAGFAVVGSAASVAEALSAHDDVDIFVVDFQLDTPLSPRQLSQLSARAAVVVFSGRADDAAVQACLGQGAAAVADKGLPLAELDRLLLRVAAGHRDAPTLTTAPPSSSFGLSERELEVYRSLVRCQTPKEVAAELGIAKSTVYCHIDRIRQKLGVETLQEIVAHGLRHVDEDG